MDIHFEQRVLYNPLMCGLVIWRFARSYFDASDQSEAPDLPTSLIVVPMVLHKRTVAVIHRMQRASGLIKALTDEPFIRVGLQERLENFAPLSFRAIHTACCSGLLAIERTSGFPRLVPTSRWKNIPSSLAPSSEDVRSMIHTAERLGFWFAAMDFQTICRALDIGF